MMKTFASKSLVALCATMVCTLGSAKLPPLTPEATLKASEAAAKQAWAGKVDNYKLCLVQDRVVAHYRKTASTATPATASGSGCTEPGPFAYTPPADKPIEAAGAHSPPGTASSPPSTKVPSAATPVNKP